MDIVNKIEDVKTSQDRPIKDVKIVDSGELPIEESDNAIRAEL
jgi:hypothetical protein